MKLTIQKSKPFIQIKEIEIESFEWQENHVFRYVIKDSCFLRPLEDDEEIIGLRV